LLSKRSDLAQQILGTPEQGNPVAANKKRQDKRTLSLLWKQVAQEKVQVDKGVQQQVIQALGTSEETENTGDGKGAGRGAGEGGPGAGKDNAAGLQGAKGMQAAQGLQGAQALQANKDLQGADATKPQDAKDQAAQNDNVKDTAVADQGAAQPQIAQADTGATQVDTGVSQPQVAQVDTGVQPQVAQVDTAAPASPAAQAGGEAQGGINVKV